MIYFYYQKSKTKTKKTKKTTTKKNKVKKTATKKKKQYKKTKKLLPKRIHVTRQWIRCVDVCATINNKNS